jgi:dGTPase
VRAQNHRFPDVEKQEHTDIILLTAGLAHDLGNPPFGHQGEAAIGAWFVKRHDDDVFLSNGRKDQRVPEHLHDEFIQFEGNAQTIRILCRLQVGLGRVGLDLTAASLSSLMKYTVPCDIRDASKPSTKKYGFFESETSIVNWIRTQTGLKEGQRHPLCWLMEAADDIAYSVLDIEDAIKKDIISPEDVCSELDERLPGSFDELKRGLKEKFKKTHNVGLSIKEAREIRTGYLRACLMDHLLVHVSDQYIARADDIYSFQICAPLLSESRVCDVLKSIAKRYVFTNKAVRRVEADGFQYVEKLMDFFWNAIHQREDQDKIDSRPSNAIAAYGRSLISDNYMQCCVRGGWTDRRGNELPIRYRELRLLTDMIAGMTDGFAEETANSISRFGNIG